MSKHEQTTQTLKLQYTFFKYGEKRRKLIAACFYFSNDFPSTKIDNSNNNNRINNNSISCLQLSTTHSEKKIPLFDFVSSSSTSFITTSSRCCRSIKVKRKKGLAKSRLHVLPHSDSLLPLNKGSISPTHWRNSCIWSQSYQTLFLLVFQFLLLSLTVCNLDNLDCVIYEMAELKSKKRKKYALMS